MSEKKWDCSRSYVYRCCTSKEPSYYMATVLFNDNNREPKIDSDVRGYYLVIFSVPEFNPETQEIGKPDTFFMDTRLLVECYRRGEANFNKALEMMEEEAQLSMETMELDKKYIESLAKWRGISVEQMKEDIEKQAEMKLNGETEENSLEKLARENNMSIDELQEILDVEPKEEKKEKKKASKKKKITFDDIAGLEDVKEVMRDVIDQFNYPEKYEHFDIPPYRSLLLHGKPGTGKTFIANAFANEMDAKFIKVSLGEMGSKYQNQTSNNITKLFKEARAENGNVILLLDEVDSLATKRGDSSNDKEKNNTLNTLLQEMSSDDNDNIFIICATNFYELLDPAFCRVGRIDVTLEIGLPNVETRLQILQLNTKRKPLGEDVDLQAVAEQMEGKNCADVAFVCNSSARIALKKDKMEINQEDFMEALEKMNCKKEVVVEKKIGFSL